MAVCLAVVGICLPQSLFAAVPTDQTPAATDVALHQGAHGNLFAGRVLDQQGAPQADAPVFLLAQGQKLTETRTDQNGSFAFANLRGGVYQVATTDALGVYRVWMPGTAPPSAQPTALLVAGDDLVRGQCHKLRHCFAGARFWLTHPCVVAGLIGAGVAIPILVINCDHEPRSP